MTHDWAALAAELEREPGSWRVIATDLPVGTAHYVRKRYGIDVRLERIDRTTHRAGIVWGCVGAPEYWMAGPTTIARTGGDTVGFLTTASCRRVLKALRKNEISPDELRWKA